MNTLKNHTYSAAWYNQTFKTALDWILIPTLFLLLSCSEEQEVIAPDLNDDVPQAPEGYGNVDEDLWIYFDRFELEASARGFVIDLRAEDLTGEVSEIESRNVAGRCNYRQRFPNRVTINLDFWRRSGDRSREFVVFHELGHCVLYRAHKETANAFNVCESVMRSGTGTYIDNYNRATRTDYLDELFDEKFRGDIFFAAN